MTLLSGSSISDLSWSKNLPLSYFILMTTIQNRFSFKVDILKHDYKFSFEIGLKNKAIA